jgi:arabinan endo-1,5-alpha-L-arabinosidase
MKLMKIKLGVIGVLFVAVLHAQPVPIAVGTQLQINNVPIHDPVMMKQDSMYYLFATGNGISVWSSEDRKTWKKEKPLFDAPPAWAVALVPGFKGHIWAPDISYHNGLYYLYYSVSAFGKNTSCIGVAVNKTLNPNASNYRWEDKGKLIQSVPGRDLWNAIDPNLIVDENNMPWLSFGSWWGGIKLVKLAASLTSLAEPQEWYSIARRPRDYATNDTSGGAAAIEGPFIYKRGKYYYLFVSFDICCQGPKSTYKIMVGRSEKVTGPYFDKAGVRMDRNGGTLLLQGDSSWYAAGHNSVYDFDAKTYMIFHGYDARDKGRSKLRIEELVWDAAGWPIVKSSLVKIEDRRTGL